MMVMLQRPETGLRKPPFAPPDHDLDPTHPTHEKMKQLVGSALVKQHDGKSWTIIVPSGQSIESTKFAITLGRFTLNVTEQIVFIRPICDKWFE